MTISSAQRDEALRLLEGDSRILSVARDVSQLLREKNVEGAVVGGVAVVLHGHVRTTLDVDVNSGDLHALAAVLEHHGFTFDAGQKQFTKNNVPVHLVSRTQLGDVIIHPQEIDGIRTVSLADLINMKLRSGLRDPLWAQDVADVIGLIRCRGLISAFASQIDREHRQAFREFVDAIGKQR